MLGPTTVVQESPEGFCCCFSLILFNVCECFIIQYVSECLCTMCLVYTAVRSPGIPVIDDCEATMWVLGIEPGSSPRTLDH